MIVKKFHIFNAVDQSLWGPGYNTLEEANAACKDVNGNMKPAFANYMVVELTDPQQK